MTLAIQIITIKTKVGNEYVNPHYIQTIRLAKPNEDFRCIVSMTNDCKIYSIEYPETIIARINQPTKELT